MPLGFYLQVDGFDADGEEIIVHNGSVLVLRSFAEADDSDSIGGGTSPGDGGTTAVPDAPAANAEFGSPRPWEFLPSPRSFGSSPRTRSPYGSDHAHSHRLCAASAPCAQPLQKYVDVLRVSSCNLADAREQHVLPSKQNCKLFSSTELWAPITCKQPDGAGLPNTATGAPRNDSARWRCHGLPVGRFDPFSPVDTEAYAKALLQVAEWWHNPWTDTLFFVLAPDTVPDILNLPLRLPATLAEAWSAIEECRDEDRARQFPVMTLAFPQPDRRFAVLVSQPEWWDSPVVVADCRAVNSCLFCLPVPSHTDREALLALLGIGLEADVAVYALDFPWALQPGQRIELKSGDVLFCVPNGSLRPPCFHIGDMLQTSEHWDAQVDIPAPEGKFCPPSHRHFAPRLSDRARKESHLQRGRR